MVAVVGNVFSLEYKCHVPLRFEGQAVRTCGWLYATKFFNLLAVGLLAISFDFVVFHLLWVFLMEFLRALVSLCVMSFRGCA
jgi:hypothetical protein